VRYRDATGKHHSETKTRLVDAERRKAEIEVALATATWRDPRRGELSLAEWAQAWLPTRFDLRPTTWARLETTMQKQVLPYFGSVPLNKITNAIVREWVSTLLSSGLSAATTRKAVFALRQCLAAAIADERVQINPASAVPLPPRSPRAIYRKARSSVLSTRCLLNTAPLCWSARTPVFAGEKLQVYAGATSTRCAPTSA
jgi:hypothetical protein